MTHTYALLAVPPSFHRMVEEKLREANYHQAIDVRPGGTILDMHGIALVPTDKEPDIPDMFEDVAAFHRKYDQPRTDHPRVLPRDLFEFRAKFHQEECVDEYNEHQDKIEEELAIPVFDRKERTIVNGLAGQLDALVDGVFVLLGTADVQFGKKAFYEAWRRAVAANMTKVKAEATGDDRSHRDAKFDVVKPADFIPPDHSDLVMHYTYEE